MNSSNSNPPATNYLLPRDPATPRPRRPRQNRGGAFLFPLLFFQLRLLGVATSSGIFGIFVPSPWRCVTSATRIVLERPFRRVEAIRALAYCFRT